MTEEVQQPLAEVDSAPAAEVTATPEANVNAPEVAEEANALAGTSVRAVLANSDKSASKVVIGRDNR